MAKIKLGAFVTEISGKVGGTIFSRNRGGAYVKNRVVGSNPRTTAQSRVRSFFSSISQAWRNLTQSQRDAWEGLAEQQQTVDSLGDVRRLSGSSLHQQRNLNRLNIGESILTSPVASEDTPDSEFTLEPVTPNQILLTMRANLAGNTVQVFATAPVSPGISNLGSRFRKIGNFVPQELTGDVNVLNAYTARFGAPVIGQRIGLRTISVERDSGVAGVEFRTSAIVMEP